MADISSQARGRVGTGETRTVEGVNRDRSSPEVEGVEEYMHGQPLDPVSSLRKGAACLQTRTLAKVIEPRVVLFILATKLLSDLSSVDIALGSIDCLSKLFRRCRYMWISPFTETHVETV